ncbi:MAG: alpha/beta hydrolase [Anaerolineaceae bacterium]|nr:alpha/beta hydrolase [Anaerolineaceae bacterium]
MNSKKLLKFFLVFDLLILIILFAYFYLNQEKLKINQSVRASVAGEFVELSDGYVHYEQKGPLDGELVVLVHGFSVPYYVWDPIVEELVSQGYQVIRYDLFGRGYSDRPNVEYDLNFFVHQLDELTTSLIPGKSFHLMGLSMGAPIVATYAHQNPEKVISLSLIAPEVLPVVEKDIFPMNVPLLGELIVGVYLVPFHLPQSQIDDFYQPEKISGWEDQYRVQMQYKGFKNAIFSTIRNLVKIDPLPEYEKVHQTGIPIMLIWGREDQSVSYEAIEKLVQVIPGAEILFVEEAGHLPHYEKPAFVTPEMIEFLKSQP